MLSLLTQLRSLFAAIVIPLSVIAAWFIYSDILGDPDNFVGGDPANEPLKGNFAGTIYKGGPLVILLLSFQIILVSYILERFISITKASGRTGNHAFVGKIREMLRDNNLGEAIAACDRQKGSVANVVKSGVQTLMRVSDDNTSDKEQRALVLQKELEEATQLELPQLNRNMIVISTLAQISTLIGLLGTVTGMIQSFAALARVGAPDAVGLAAGISEALVTTALGISSAAVAIVFFNYFTNRIDQLTFAIDESSYSILATFKSRA